MARGNDERNNSNRKVGKLNTEYMSERLGQMFSSLDEERKRHSASLGLFEKNKVTSKNFHDVASAIKYFGYDKTQGGRYADFIKHYDDYMNEQGN